VRDGVRPGDPERALTAALTSCPTAKSTSPERNFDTGLCPVREHAGMVGAPRRRVLMTGRRETPAEMFCGTPSSLIIRPTILAVERLARVRGNQIRRTVVHWQKHV
jgi:hypothetical protein